MSAVVVPSKTISKSFALIAGMLLAALIVVLTLTISAWAHSASGGAEPRPAPAAAEEWRCDLTGPC